MKLYRVEVERSEFAVLYVPAMDPREAQGLAVRAAVDLESSSWYPVRDGAIEANSSEDMRHAQPTCDDECDVEMVSGDPEGRTVAEWLAANENPTRCEE